MKASKQLSVAAPYVRCAFVINIIVIIIINQWPNPCPTLREYSIHQVHRCHWSV